MGIMASRDTELLDCAGARVRCRVRTTRGDEGAPEWLSCELDPDGVGRWTVFGRGYTTAQTMKVALAAWNTLRLKAEATKLTPAQERVMMWLRGGWCTEPGAGSAVMVNGKRVCNTDTMMALARAGLVAQDTMGRWTATGLGRSGSMKTAAQLGLTALE